MPVPSTIGNGLYDSDSHSYQYDTKATHGDGSYSYSDANASSSGVHQHNFTEGIGGFDGKFGDFDGDFDGRLFDGDEGRGSWLSLSTSEYLSFVMLVVVVVCVVPVLCGPCMQDAQNCWRRRVQAARYRRVGASDTAEIATADEEDVGFLEVVTSSLTSGPVVECVVDLGDATEPRKCDVCVAELEKLSELPFVLTDGCKASGDAALIGLSIVDLFIRRTVQIEYMPPGREAFREVGDAKTTTPAQLRAATAFRVTVMTN